MTRFILLLILAGCEADMPITDETDASPSTFVKSAVATFVPSHQPRARLLYILGDSITEGYDATDRATQGVAALLARDYPGRIVNNSVNGRRLYQIALTPELRTSLIATIAASDPSELWIQLGTNDFGSAGILVADFQAMYISLLDELHVALPDMRIFAQSMIYRGVATNSNGETMVQFRSAVLAATSGRAWVTYVNGLPMVTNANPDNMPDNTHPNDAGHIQYTAAWRAAMTAAGYGW